MRKDYLPANDKMLAIMLQTLYETVSNHLTEWGISATELYFWSDDLKPFAEAVRIAKDPATRTVVATRHKNDLRKMLLTKVRPFIQGRLIHNARVKSSDLVAMGIKPRDRIHTPVPRPSQRPSMQVVPTNLHQHTVKVINPDTRTNKKPLAEYMVRYAWDFCETPPVSAGELRNSQYSRKTVQIFNYNEADSGKHVFYAARYENLKGESGSWSDIVERIIS
jgi:hypothetical protein